MNVSNRKLFANRDARRRLAEMGGIVSSYPELMGVAQQFQEGGRVTYQQWQNMSRSERQAAGLPTSVIGGQRYFNRFGVGLGRNDPQTGERITPVYSMEEGVSRPIDLTAAQPVLDELGIRPEDFSRLTPAEQQDILGFEDVTSPMREQGAETYEPYEVGPRGRGFVAETFFPGRAAEVRATEAAAARRAEREAERRELEAPEPETEDTAAQTPDEDTPRPMARPQSIIEATEAAMAESDDPSSAAANEVIRGVGGEEPADTLEGRISQYERIFQNMFGESDEARARERAMNLAMIGFAIASGEDPSALRNISQGLLQGTAQMREDAATRRQREDRIQELAVAAGLEDERLARRLASSEREALLRAAGSADGTRFSPTEPYVDAVRTVAESAMTQGLYDSIEEALAASSAALRPYYASTEDEGGDETGMGGEVPELDLNAMQQAEEAARARGDETFTFNGLEYPVR